MIVALQVLTDYDFYQNKNNTDFVNCKKASDLWFQY